MDKTKVIKAKINTYVFSPKDITYWSNSLVRLTEEEIVQSDFEYLVAVYPKMEELFKSLFKLIPDTELPLLISQSEYPQWVRMYIEDQFRNRKGVENEVPISK